MKTALVVQARNGSSRFPKKMIHKIVDRTVLEWVLQRAGKSNIEEKIVATSYLSEDDSIEEIAKAYNWKVFRGDPSDVLSRYAKIVEDFKLNTVIRITGDCPLIDFKIIEHALDKYIRENADYLVVTSIIDGFDVEVISGQALLIARDNAKLPSEREHVTPHIRKSKKFKKIFTSYGNEDLSHIHLSLDYPDDLYVIEKIIKKLANEDFTYEDVVSLIKREPEVLKRNREIKPNEGYLKSMQEDKEFITSMKGKSLNLKENLRHFEKTKKLIPNCSQTFSKSYLQFSVGASPLFVKEGKGVYLKDLDENVFIDYTMGLGACILGYAFEPIVEEIKSQLLKGTVYTLPHFYEYELAEILVELIPCAEMVRFGKNGSDVTSAAVRLARAYTGRDMIACCGYHGWQDWYISTTTRNRGIPEDVKKLTLTFEYNNIESLKRLFDEHSNKIACVIMEPVGVEEPKDDFLKKVKDLTHKNGALLIFDEVVTGFRFSLGGAQEYFGVVPDIACFGKAMGNGMPISAIVGRKEIMELFEDVFFSFTFGGETLSIVSAISTINFMIKNEVISHLWTRGERLKSEILKIIKDKEIEDLVFVKGYPVRFILDFSSEDTLKLKTLFQQECAKRGILFSGSHNISFCHSDDIIERTLQVYSEVLI